MLFYDSLLIRSCCVRSARGRTYPSGHAVSTLADGKSAGHGALSSRRRPSLLAGSCERCCALGTQAMVATRASSMMCEFPPA